MQIVDFASAVAVLIGCSEFARSKYGVGCWNLALTGKNLRQRAAHSRARLYNHCGLSVLRRSREMRGEIALFGLGKEMVSSKAPKISKSIST